jgi:hypothetical protein
LARPIPHDSRSTFTPVTPRRHLVWLGAALLQGALSLPLPAAVGDATLLADRPTMGAFPLVDASSAAPLYTDAADWPGVRRAAGDLQTDIERVTALRPEILAGEPASAGPAVIIGTLGKSEVIDRLVAAGKLDVGAIRGKWEAFLIATVERPLPGVDRALVIAGSDKRGTIYGIYEISKQIGVSPWYWWADVPVRHRNGLLIRPGILVEAGPVVKYRGIFLNDEAPDLTNWVRAKYGTVSSGANPHVPPGIANYGREFYSRLFEVMLRLRANYLWPAMWNNAFNEDDPVDAGLADQFGIVMGTSHQEPMLRAQKEWDWRYLKTIGTWNYAKNPDLLEDFWREGIRRNRDFESVVTIGLRGANDTPMAEGGPEANRALLEKIVDAQRKILREEMKTDPAKVPQLWCLYKEVQDYYEAGMRVPDDVTLLWADDNWGDLRRAPTAAERRRSGGAGIYYHFDYHGGPRSYQWINSNPLPKVWEQMSLAHQYGADRVWIVNVGHFKGYELPTEFFLNMAWNPDRWTGENLGDFTVRWAAREFGREHAAAIAAIMEKYAKYNGRRKPELLAPDTYSLTDYREAETVVADYSAVAGQAQEIARDLPAAAQDAYYELVLFPVKAGALVNELYLAAGRNALFARQGRASAGAQAAETRRFFHEYLDLIGAYNTTFAGGRWAHFMDQPVLGYVSWRDPKANNIDNLKLVEPSVPAAAGLGVAAEGSDGTTPAALQFDAFNRQSRYIDVFNRGQEAFDFTVTASAPWIRLSSSGGQAGPDQRIEVTVDWTTVPTDESSGSVSVAGAGQVVTIAVQALNSSEVTQMNLHGFVEAQGAVSIEPEHFTHRTEVGERRWTRIDGYGRTLSGMRADAPVDARAAIPGIDSPVLEYQFYVFHPGPADVTAIVAPTLRFAPDRGLSYAVSLDDEAPQVVELVPKVYQVDSRNRDWDLSVSDNARYSRSHHQVLGVGYHTLKIWMIDPAVVVQKLVVDLGGVRPSYLGPPESYRSP